ncbi:MAG: glycosyltransferase family 2 protein [Methanosphaera stadtmanae]|nr:glycosyltransferase family 2 protein [Methanosphaera stadtmanae]
MVKVSVVIPIYNVEAYLEDCLKSVLNQTLTDIEVICVNDGSTDKSLSILEKYAKEDKRMIVINQENAGHAVATNIGMTYATGEYLFLMDSDDIIEFNALELTYNKARENDVDFVIFKAINYNNAEEKYYETKSYTMKEVYNQVHDNVFSYEEVKDLIFMMSVTPWSKLYNRRFISENNIIFPEGLIFDDNIFFWEVLFNAKRIVFLNEFLFIRRFYSTSSTNNGDLRFLDSIKINKLIWDTFKKYDYFDYHKNHLYNNMVLSIYNRYTKIKDEYKNIFFQEMKKAYMTILEDEDLFNDFMENVDDNNKKLFIQVLSTENPTDFELLRETYGSIIKNPGGH